MSSCPLKHDSPSPSASKTLAFFQLRIVGPGWSRTNLRTRFAWGAPDSCSSPQDVDVDVKNRSLILSSCSTTVCAARTDGFRI